MLLISFNFLHTLYRRNSKIYLEFPFSAFLRKVGIYFQHFGVKSHFSFSGVFTDMDFDIFIGHPILVYKL